MFNFYLTLIISNNLWSFSEFATTRITNINHLSVDQLPAARRFSDVGAEF
ncbi:hypothetical protein SAMN05660691_02514 [Rheinheimera pacifica]|jgi:hypothetical protein|uniref:Uncharacterized protein n=1 Tax=Rheinheimera pacifica TaxID=173990 RepID=A0A1H6MG90_9GAMM|nr:hypothetical protein SAMN05660691_02514 [Rheinheimera pacifica]